MKTRLGGLMAVAMISLLCTSGVASAKSLKAIAPFQEGNATCGLSEPFLPEIGTVKWKRTGNELTMKVKLTKGVPEKPYYATVLVNGCEFYGTYIVFTTNKKGKGKGSATFEIPEGDTEFFANVWRNDLPGTPSEFNNTPYVSLPKP